MNMSSLWKEQADKIRTRFKSQLKRVDNSDLPVQCKIEYLNTVIIPSMEASMCNTSIPLTMLDDWAQDIKNNVRQWLGQATNSNNSYFFVPRKYGGLGIRHPRIIYLAKRVSFALSVLNSDDVQVRFSARTSLVLHMEKRKIPQALPGNPQFAGYQVTASETREAFDGARSWIEATHGTLSAQEVESG